MRLTQLLRSTFLLGVLHVSAWAQSIVESIQESGVNTTIFVPGDPAFTNLSRPFNLRFDFDPALISVPNSVQEISQLVKLGEKINHQVVARSGGHSYVANGLGGKDGSIVIDLRNFQKITVDPKSGTAVIESGARLGDIVSALVAHGRALPHGTCPYVGIGGHAAYGGFGFTSRLWGLALDTIISMDVVLADGTITTASATQNPDLFWAMRGAGSSFGITTSITVRTFPAPSQGTIFSFNWQFTADQAAVALGKFQDFVLHSNFPPEIGAEIVLTPGAVQGNVSMGLAGGWYGPVDQLNSTLAPFMAVMPPPRTSSFDIGDYLHSAINLAGGSLDTMSAPDGTDTFYAKSLMTPQSSPMSDGALKAFMSVLANEGFTAPVGWFIQAEVFGGNGSAINAIKTADTAFSRRDALFTIQFYASSHGNVPPYPEGGFTFLDNIVNSIVKNSPKDWDYGAYTNYIDDRLVDWQKSQGFKVLTSTDSGYASASAAFNRRYTFKPAAVTYPRNTQDVSTIVKISAQYNYSVAARSGGHSYIANALGGKDGAVVVDLSLLNTVKVNSSSKVATIGTGNRLGDVALALNNNGRAMPHGTCPYVGIGGHSGHGGFGFASRAWGLTLDTIQSLEVVLANGTIATASTSNYPDLFWALRGSSSSFGIVTSISANTFAAPSSVTTFSYIWDLSTSAATSATLAFQTFSLASSTPAELGLEIVLGRGSSKGRVFFQIQGAYYGSNSNFNNVINPLLNKLPSVQSKSVTARTYIDSVKFFGGIGRLNTTGQPDETDTFYAKSLMTPQGSPMSNAAEWFIEIELWGGPTSVINSVPLDATSFGRRNSLLTIQFYTSAPNYVPPFPQQGFTLLDDMISLIVQNSPSGWDYGAYTNYIDDRLSNWQQQYYGSHYSRLESLKRSYDPKNMFRFPTSIEE
ncbi:hypothetical protein CVT24_000103 [Panaeolus cyanescens]|uniref:FAD-binding PCMH-type domain-containing protein n=1 Tax=Panaeolus cyanescens TaxID=181874 RepID=A0A409W7U1_9AGAR|nr:hypothetical protein CVT24_000103 [Panaeolus cyanescens]